MGVGLITLLGFGLPPLLRLGSVSPLRVLRRDLDPPAASFWLALAAGLAALSVLTFWQTADARLSAVVLGSFLGTLGVLLLAARGLVFLLTRMRGRDRGLWAYGLDSLARDPATCSLQVAGLGLGILVLLLLGMVRLDLLGAWEASLPKDRPNQFALNIQPDEVDAVRDFLAANGLPGTDLYPMVRGRLTMINGRPVEPADYSGTRAKRLARREFNLSWADQMQSDNRVVQGQWWGGQSVDDSLFSVEQGLAETLGLELGDMLTFSVAGVPIEGRIASLRSVQWDSFNANFFVIATPTLLRDMPATYITSFYLSTDRKDIPARLVRNFPSVSVLDIESLIRQVREVMDRGALAVEYVFLFTLAAGLVVLYAGIQASREIRIQEAAILRTLGCNRRRLLVAVSVEFAVLGALASVIACSAAQLSGYLLATQVFDLPYQPDLKLWWVGLTAGTLGIAFSGILATYPLLARTPLNLLRRA
jgi:putative ABC transport system permease protein